MVERLMRNQQNEKRSRKHLDLFLSEGSKLEVKNCGLITVIRVLSGLRVIIWMTL